MTDMTPLATSNPATRNDRRLSEKTNADADRTSNTTDPILPDVSAVVEQILSTLHLGLLR